jgi:hypothetical protein
MTAAARSVVRGRSTHGGGIRQLRTEHTVSLPCHVPAATRAHPAHFDLAVGDSRPAPGDAHGSCSASLPLGSAGSASAAKTPC